MARKQRWRQWWTAAYLYPATRDSLILGALWSLTTPGRTWHDIATGLLAMALPWVHYLAKKRP